MKNTTWYMRFAKAAAHFCGRPRIFVLAVLAGIASHVPGGLGVFETVMLLAALLAAMVLYRVVHSLLPLALALPLLLAGGMAAWRRARSAIAWCSRCGRCGGACAACGGC